jgi:sulfonate transport system substrate-binding protein
MKTDESTRRRQRFAAAFSALAAAALLAACGSSSVSGSSSSASGGSGSASGGSNASSSTSASASSGPAKVSVVNSSFKGATLRVGDQAGTGAQALLTSSGLIKKLPFKIKFADFTSGPPMLEAMGSGSLDIGGVGNAPAIFAAAGGAKISVVGALANNPASADLLVPKGSKITSIQQLKGKKIAVAQGSSADYHLLTVLNKAGLSPKDVTLEYLQPAEAQAAFSSGAVDAWDVWSPFIEQAIGQDHAKVLTNGSGYGSNFSYEVAADSSIKNATTAKEIHEYLTTLDQAHRWADTHAAAWAATWAQATGLPDSIMTLAAKDDTQIPVPVDGKIQAQEQSVVDAFSKAALIPKHYSFAPYISSAFNDSVGQ